MCLLVAVAQLVASDLQLNLNVFRIVIVRDSLSISCTDLKSFLASNHDELQGLPSLAFCNLFQFRIGKLQME